MIGQSSNQLVIFGYINVTPCPGGVARRGVSDVAPSAAPAALSRERFRFRLIAVAGDNVGPWLPRPDPETGRLVFVVKCCFISGATPRAAPPRHASRTL